MTRDAATSGPEFSDEVANRNERSSSDFYIVVVRVTLATKVSIATVLEPRLYNRPFTQLYAAKELVLHLSSEGIFIKALHLFWPLTCINTFKLTYG